VRLLLHLRAGPSLSVVPVGRRDDHETVEPSHLYLDVGEQGQLTALPLDANGFLVEDADISWFATGVASVDSSGLVTGLAPGSCQVSATHLGLTAYASVTVTAP
jgi:uncharacterized protein YjdB